MTESLRLLDVNRESNVPTTWNAMLLLAVSGACVVVACLAPPGARLRRGGWALPAVVAAVMAVDEVVRLHERIGGLDGPPGDGLAAYGWVVPGAVVAAAGVAGAVLWSRRLPSDVRRQLLVAAAVYLCGALGLEAVSGWVHQELGAARLYTMLTAGEELLEMTGCVIAFAGVLRMLRVVDLDGSRAWRVRSDA